MPVEELNLFFAKQQSSERPSFFSPSPAEAKRIARKAGLGYSGTGSHCEEAFCRVACANGKAACIPAPWNGGRAKCSLILLRRLIAKLPCVPIGMEINICAHPNAFQCCGGLRLRQAPELKRRAAAEAANAPAAGASAAAA